MARWLALLVVMGIGTLCAGPVRAQGDSDTAASDRDDRSASSESVDENPFGGPAPAETQADNNPFAPDQVEESTAGNPFAATSSDEKKPKRDERRIAAKRDEPRRMRTAEELRNELDKPTIMEFVDTPLQDAVAYLKDFHGIEIQLDVRALEDMGVGTDTPVSANFKAIRFREALRYLLDQFDLDYVIQDSMLLITTKDVASQMREVRVYDVSECVGPSIESNELVGLVGELIGHKYQIAKPRYPSQPQPATAAAPRQASNTTTENTRFVIPLRDVLIVRASQREHEEIEKALGDLRKALADGE